MIQAASDVFLGWLRTERLDGLGRDFYVRQLWDWKVSADDRDACAAEHGRLRRDCAGGRWRGPMPAPATASPSPSTWVRGHGFDEASPTSPRPTPTRTSATTRRWPRR